MMRFRQILTFLGIFALILALSHVYMFERIDYYLQLSGGGRIAVASALGGFAFLTLLSLPLSRMLPRALASALAWVVYPWMGIALLMFVTFVTTDIVWLGLQMAQVALPGDARHMFGVAALSVSAVLSAVAFWKGLEPVRVRRKQIRLEKLPAAFDNFRIVQITDLHIGPMISGDWLQKVVDKVNGLKPDLIAITGDLVDGSVEELARHTAPIADLRAKHGVYFITGNHEYYSGVEEWCAHVAGLSIKVLRNQRVSISTGAEGESFDLAGVDDWASGSFPGQGPDLGKALAGRDTTKTLILLAHQPAAIAEAAGAGVDLQLSGHTHGGQIWPFTYLVYLQQPYAAGLHRFPGTQAQIYVSPGTGFWGPPMRLGTRAEITCIDLRSRKA